MCEYTTTSFSAIKDKKNILIENIKTPLLNIFQSLFERTPDICESKLEFLTVVLSSNEINVKKSCFNDEYAKRNCNGKFVMNDMIGYVMYISIHSCSATNKRAYI